MPLQNLKIYNFANKNTISSISNEKEALLTTFEKDSEKAIDWFRTNMIVNPGKFQPMILQRSENSDVHTIEIDGNEIERTSSICYNRFIYSNFYYCPLVWHFSPCKALRKIENIHKRCLRMIHNDHD